jgi:hypothetical protein
MKITLTVKAKDELVNGKRTVEFKEKDFELDMSLNAQIRWEKRFPELATKEELLTYAERVEKAKITNNGNISLATLIAQMKVLYCYFDCDLPFDKFLAMFDFSKQEYSEKLIKQITEAFEIINNEASEKN